MLQILFGHVRNLGFPFWSFLIFFLFFWSFCNPHFYLSVYAVAMEVYWETQRRFRAPLHLLFGFWFHVPSMGNIAFHIRKNHGGPWYSWNVILTLPLVSLLLSHWFPVLIVTLAPLFFYEGFCIGVTCDHFEPRTDLEESYAQTLYRAIEFAADSNLQRIVVECMALNLIKLALYQRIMHIL